MTCIAGENLETSKDAFKRTRIPIGGRLGLVLLLAKWRALLLIETRKLILRFMHLIEGRLRFVGWQVACKWFYVAQKVSSVDC
jgi:hypothetical protein